MRRAGVAGDEDGELLANLAAIAREDADAGVRAVAMKRLADPGLTQRLAHEDADAGVRAEARKLWFDLLAGTHAYSPTPSECVRLIRAQDDAALIEHVARTAVDLSLRAAALARVTRVAFLAERAVADPDPQLRLSALDRIEDKALLDRLAERTRRTDKLVSRRARERAESLRIAHGDPAVAETRARLLCERIERLIRDPQDRVEAEIQAQWEGIEAHASEGLRARYRAAQTLLIAARERPASAALAETSSEIETVAAPTHDVAGAHPVSMHVPAAADDAVSEDERDGVSAPHVPIASAAPTDNESSATNLDVATNASDAFVEPATGPLLAETPPTAPSSAANADAPRGHEQRRAELDQIESAANALEIALTEGVVARAHAAHAELAALRKTHRGALPRSLQHRLNEAERVYAKLSQWQHWSDNQRRRQLCESIETMAGSGLHPDAVATRVREAQAEWSRLDAAEGIAAGAHAQHGLARRFHAACRHALEPAKSYFKKRQELRKTHAQAISDALEQARAVPDDSSDWPLIAKTRTAVVEALRTLDRVDPHERKNFARDLKTVLTALDARVSAHQDEVERAKSALIAEAQALSAGEAIRGAPAAARALQQRWQAIGNGRRSRDQAQWKIFRAALDAVFGKLDSERAERAARDADSLARAAAICAELENIAAAPEPSPRATVAGAESEFEALGVRDDALLRRFRAAQSSLREAGMRRERATRRSPYEAWLARYRLCREAERGDADAESLRSAWQQVVASDIAAASLTERFETALDAKNAASPSVEGDADDANDAALREVLIRLELFTGVESPQEDADRRRALQIERLSARMRGGAATTPQLELAALLTRWTELAPATAELDARLERGLAMAIETLP